MPTYSSFIFTHYVFLPAKMIYLRSFRKKAMEEVVKKEWKEMHTLKNDHDSKHAALHHQLLCQRAHPSYKQS